MRQLVVIAEMGVGGAEAVVESLAHDAVARGDEVAVASAGGFRADRLAAEGVRIVTVPLGGRRPADLVKAARALRRELTGHRPDVMHVHNVKAAAIVAAARFGLRRVPTIVTLHGVPDGDYAAAARVLRRAADRVVAVSADVRDRLTAAGYPVTRIDVIENAIQPLTLDDRIAARARLELAPDVPVAVCLARLVDQKRHDLLVTAWRAVPGDAVLLIAGDGPNRARITTQANDDPRIALLGAREDVDVLLSAADLSVLPSDWEGLPISVLEALAAGVPVVASAVGGLPAALGDAACLVEPGSAAALADGITRVLSDGDYRAHLVAAGRELTRTRFSAQVMLDAYRETTRQTMRQTTQSTEGARRPMKSETWQGGRSERPLLQSLRNATKPGFLPVMARKVMVRVRERTWRAHPEAVSWAASHAESVDAYARALDPALWDEAVAFGAELRSHGEKVLTPLGIDLGGGGHYPLLYFLVRHGKPAVVVETGVAAGYSSRAILTALAANDAGHLYSSDFPYFRMEEPEKYIGVLVEPELRERWTLRTKGDRANLPEILAEVDGVDLFHYDSDKPVDGRRFALDAVSRKLRPGAVVLMDDIQDNEHFQQHVESTGAAFKIFEFGGKYIGAIGLP
jgi:glycosyltransferase involved in cell wall biosynthesis/predicted O-methyltransferase YrrM